MAVAFGNSVQLGIPMATALFGEDGLAIHIPLVSLHALILLSVLTALVELDLARAAHGRGTDLHSMRRALTTTRRVLARPPHTPLHRLDGDGKGPGVIERLRLFLGHRRIANASRGLFHAPHSPNRVGGVAPP